MPLPATVVMIPLVFTFRMRLLPLSAMYTLPSESTVTPFGLLSPALSAGPLSPE